MTLKQAEALIAEWQPLLCPEWEITLAEGPSPHWAANDHLAATNTKGGGDYLRATIHLHEVVGDALSDEDARQTLLHELLHLTLNDLELAAKEPTNALSYDAGRLAKETIDRFIERTVGRLRLTERTAWPASNSRSPPPQLPGPPSPQRKPATPPKATSSPKTTAAWSSKP